MPDAQFTLGQMDGNLSAMQRELGALKDEVHEVKQTVAAIKSQLDTVAGAWKVAVWVAGVLGALLGWFAKVSLTKGSP